MHKIRKINLGIGLIAFFCCISSLILMHTKYYGIVKYLDLLAILIVLLLSFKTLRMIVKHWSENYIKKIELVLQIALLLGVFVSGITVGNLQ